MKSLSRFIHKSSITFLATHYPVHFYGLHNGKVYLCFARFYGAGFNNTDLEFAFAGHNYCCIQLQLRGYSIDER